MWMPRKLPTRRSQHSKDMTVISGWRREREREREFNRERVCADGCVAVPTKRNKRDGCLSREQWNHMHHGSVFRFSDLPRSCWRSFRVTPLPGGVCLFAGVRARRVVCHSEGSLDIRASFYFGLVPTLFRCGVFTSVVRLHSLARWCEILIALLWVGATSEVLRISFLRGLCCTHIIRYMCCLLERCDRNTYGVVMYSSGCVIGVMLFWCVCIC